MQFENLLSQKLHTQQTEKTFIDKLLGRKEAERLRELIKKDDLTREELLELLYMLSNIELKLTNLTEYDRYLLGKYFTWVRDLTKLAEFLYDYEQQFEKFDFKKHKEKIKNTLDQIKKMVLHDVKFGVDVFLFLARSTLGLNAFAFDSLSKSRFEYEYEYPLGISGLHQEKPPEQKTFISLRR